MFLSAITLIFLFKYRFMVLAKFCKTMLKTYGKNGYPCFVPTLRHKVFHLSILRKIMPVFIVVMILYQAKEAFFCYCFPEKKFSNIILSFWNEAFLCERMFYVGAISFKWVELLSWQKAERVRSIPQNLACTLLTHEQVMLGMVAEGLEYYPSKFMLYQKHQRS